ncbi:MAG TPA: response regulator, partial [Thermoleophilia bacterium]|nr:response regulator [Thermoleophilia bacterium]
MTALNGCQPEVQILKVAVVDDEEPLGLAISRILSKYRVLVADVGIDVAFAPTQFTSGELLFESVDAGAEFDLMLLDLKLPGMSGLEIMEELTNQNRNILTIMITAYATFETAVQATKLGGYDFLAKPFTPEELRYAIRKATNQLIINREARRLAEEKRQVRFNFISVLSHELKAPINAIEGYLKILRQDEPPERQHMVDRSLIRLDGMRKLIFDLLDLTRIESGQKQRNFTTVDLRASANAAIELFTPEAAGRGIEVTLRAKGPVVLQADSEEIDIILNNLISNAVKYNRDGGTATVG